MNSYFNFSNILTIVSLIVLIPLALFILQGISGRDGLGAAFGVFVILWIIGLILLNGFIASCIAWYKHIDNNWVAISLWIYGTIAFIAISFFGYIFYYKFTKENYEKMTDEYVKGNTDLAMRYFTYPFFINQSQKVDFAGSYNMRSKDVALLNLMSRKNQAIGGAALCRAVENDQLDFIKLILSNHVNPNHICRNTVIAAQVNSQEAMNELVTAGLNLNYRNDYNNNTTFMELLHASKAYDLGREERLLKLLHVSNTPYQTNAKGHWEETALMWAAEKDYIKIADELLRQGEDPNAQDREGKTALMYATTYDFVRLLMKNQARADLKNSDDETAIDIYTKKHRVGALDSIKHLPKPDSEKLLMAIRHKNIEQVNTLKNTPLSEAERYIAIVDALSYGNIDVLNIMKPLFDSTAKKFPDTDYFNIATSSYSDWNSVMHRAWWVLKHQLLYNNRESVNRFLHDQGNAVIQYNLTEETSAFLHSLKAHEIPLEHKWLRDIFLKEVNFYTLGYMAVTDADLPYLHELINGYSEKDAQHYFEVTVPQNYYGMKNANIEKVLRALPSLDYWVKLHRNKLKSKNIFYLGYIYNDDEYVLDNYNQFTEKEKSAINECLKILIDRPVNFTITSEMVKFFTLANPSVFTGKYDLSKFVYATNY